MISTHPARPITPSSKFNLNHKISPLPQNNTINRSKRGFSENIPRYKRNNSNGSNSNGSNKGSGLSKVRIPQSYSNPSSPHKRAETFTQMQLMTPQVNAGAYIDLVSDIDLTQFGI